MTIHSATYSPEDNKIRLYASERLDAETYARVRAAGFIWAPKQELFVAPKWSPAREDLAAELAGEIEPEEMTLAERATAKAERLEALAGKRYAAANTFARRAADLSERFAMGQPILVGHHSERKARKDQDRMNAAQSKAIESERAANFWLYRAEGVEAYANMKNAPRVRAGRIKTLLTELRDWQRDINRAHSALAIWAKMTSDEQIRYALGRMDSRLTFSGWETYSAVDKGELAPAEARARCIASAELTVNGPNRRRWIDHILNRLAFERSMLGDVARYDGELTPVILQAFAREHGAEKPAARVTDPGYFELTSPVPLPLHLADSDYLELSADDWRDLMQSTGYEVPAPVTRRASNKPAPAPLVNPTAEQAEQLQRIWNLYMQAACKAHQTPEPNHVRAITQARYSANSKGDYSPLTTIDIGADGREIRGAWSNYEFKKTGEPIARIRVYTGASGFYKPKAVVHISDKPAKALPIDLDAIEAAAVAALNKGAAA